MITVIESGYSTEYRDVFLWSFEEHWVWRCWFSIHDPPVFLAGKEKMFVWCKSVCNALYVTFIFGRVCSDTPDIVKGGLGTDSGYYRDKFMDTFGLVSSQGWYINNKFCCHIRIIFYTICDCQLHSAYRLSPGHLLKVFSNYYYDISKQLKFLRTPS